MKAIPALGCMAIIAGIVCSSPAADSAQQNPSSQPSAAAPLPDSGSGSVAAAGRGAGMAALAKASAAGKYLFVFFSSSDDTNSLAMRKVFDETMGKSARKADWVAIRIGDPAEKEIVAKYGVARAPMPLVVAVAPNGAVTKGLPVKFDEKALLDAFTSPGAEKCLKALQDQKLVLLCVQNKSSKDAAAAMKGVREFTADKKFAADTGILTVVVPVDPGDPAETKFLNQLKIDPKTGQALTAFMVPPGVLLTVTKGPTTAEAFMTVLKAAMSGRCGPGGCGPGGCP